MTYKFICDSFPNCPPFSYRIRERYNSCWLRIHSLPNSKRYPDEDNDVERQILLYRHNKIASHVLGEGNQISVVHYHLKDDNRVTSEAIINRFPIMKFVSLISDENETTFLVGEFETKWNSGSFDSLILRIALWEDANFLFVNSERRAIYAPYGGGADLFLLNEVMAQSVRIKYSDWLSMNEFGL